MNDLIYYVKAAWNGTGANGEGELTFGDQVIPYSVPGNMGGKGKGASPETLLISAVTTCYSGTLYHFLLKRRLPVVFVSIETEGFVSDYPEHPRYSRIEVNPTIHGGDPARQADYVTAAKMAREHCFIGQTVAAGGVTYDLGVVHIEANVPDERSHVPARAEVTVGSGVQ